MRKLGRCSTQEGSDGEDKQSRRKQKTGKRKEEGGRWEGKMRWKEQSTDGSAMLESLQSG